MEQNKINHIAIILDGNRRWAKENGLSVYEGHKCGAEKIADVVDWSIEADIRYLTLYTFSTENWKREKQEVDGIMSLFRNYLFKKLDKLFEKNICIKIIGSRNNLDNDIVTRINEVEEKTKNNSKLQINIAFNYGGRREIIDVSKKIAVLYKDGLIKLGDINENFFQQNLYFGNIPDPDIILRTGNRNRVSNFLLWELAYSELFFIDEYWPAFNKDLFNQIINNFNMRVRTYGGTKK